MNRMRAIFFGTPAFAVPTLDALVDMADVLAVVTQPDRPAGRGMQAQYSAVKARAIALDLPLLQPLKVRTPDFAQHLRALEADVAVVVAYGRILPKAVLEAPRLGCVNVHASLLPRWRGAAPVHWAIVHGDTQSGVCLMKMDEGMDTGAVIGTMSTAITPSDTAQSLSLRLASIGAELLARDLPRYLAGELPPIPQDEALATLAPILRKEDGWVRFDGTAGEVHNRVRGMTPWPGASAVHEDGNRFKIHRTHVVKDAGSAIGADGQPVPVGTIVRVDAHGIEVACGMGVVAIDELQLPGKRRMDVKTFLSGRAWRSGQRLGQSE